MTAPVDIAEAVRRAQRYADQRVDDTVPGDAARFARALLAVTDELRDLKLPAASGTIEQLEAYVAPESIEQRTAERIAEWLDSATEGYDEDDCCRELAVNAATDMRAGRWRNAEARRQLAEAAVTAFRNETKRAEVERERDEQRRLLVEFGPFKMRAAEALADEVAAMVRRREIDARCPAADALLDFRNPPERFAPDIKEQFDGALAEQRRLAAKIEDINVQLQDTQANYGELEAEVERIRPIVKAVGTWRAFGGLLGSHEDRARAAGQIGSALVVARDLDAIVKAYEAYLTAAQPPAVAPEPRYGDGTGGLVCKRCGLDWPDERETLEPHACPPGFQPPDPAEARIAELVRQLPDEQPPAGWMDRVEERRHARAFADHCPSCTCRIEDDESKETP